MPVENPVKEPVKILVVDDQAGMRLTLKGILSRKGYEVWTAEDGPQAIEAARKTDFRLILMDIKMPGMSGVETFIKIKEMNKSATVIMMTAFAMEDEIKQAIQEGAYAVIHKPFNMEKILDVIGECLKNQTLVLLVDDRIEDRNLFKHILEKKGYKVVDVGSGEECLTQVKERRFQVILLDIRLPGINGVETLKRVKQIRPDVGVIMITAYSEKELVQEAIEQGSFTCLEKPLDMENLLGVVSRCLQVEKGGRA